MAKPLFAAKAPATFQVWMLVWSFSIFWLSEAVAQSSTAYQIGDYRTSSEGTIGQTAGTASLEKFTSSGTWETTTYPLPAAATIYVQHQTEISGSLQVAHLALAPSKTLTIPAGSTLSTSARLTVTPSAVLLLQGEIENTGTLQLQTNSRLIIQTTSYQATSPLWAGSEEIDASSEVRIEKAAPNSVLFSGSALTLQPHGYWFGKLTFAPLAQGNWHVANTTAPVAAQLATFNLAAGSSLTLAGGNSLSFNFGNDLVFTGGTYYLQNQSTGTGTVTVNGKISLQAASLVLNQTSSATAVTLLDVKGNLESDASSTISNSSTMSTSSSGIRLIGTTWQEIATAGPINHVSLTVKPGAMARLTQHVRLNPSNSVYAGTFTVENGGTLDFGNDASGTGFQVQGQGYFKLDQGGTLYVTSTQGINATGTAGNVQVTDSRRTFNQVARFIYSAKVPQQTGNAFTSTSSGKVLIIDNPTTVTLTQSTGISSNTALAADGGRLEIKQGTFIATATADITSSGKLVMSGGTYQIAMTGVTVPQLTGAYEFTGGTVELTGNGDQTLRGKTYHNLIIGGTNTSGVNAKTISTTTTVNQKITILPGAILDLGNKSLKGDGGLTMTGGLLRVGKSSGTLPELLGKNAPYQLTGGTIEFYGTLNGQSQSIRGTYGTSQKITYHHLLLNAAEANTLNETGNQLLNANFDVTGTLTVNAPAVLQIASNRAIGGTGNFTLQPGSTLLYGSPQGIKLSGTGTTDGNIRVSGTRNYSPQANYGFIGNSEMVSGDGLPATVVNLLVAKTGYGVTLTKNVAVDGVFTLKSGTFKTGANELSLTSPALTALQLADSSLYIQGNLRRAIGSSGIYPFPIGNEAGKRQLDIQSNSLGGNGFQNIKVSFGAITNHKDADLQVTETNSTYHKISTEGVWFVEPNAQPSSGSYAAFGYLNGFSGLIDNQFALLVRPLASTSGRDWNTGGGTLDAPNKDGRTVASGYAKRNFIGPFGQIGIGSMETTLPVSWLYVKGERKQQNTVINWATACEINNDRFEIEFSTDGANFSKLGQVTGAGNSSTVQKYQFTHSSAVGSPSYYRIKQVDVDGKFEYSKLVNVEAAPQSKLAITLYPNPTHDFLYVSGLSSEDGAMIEILDLGGRSLDRQTLLKSGATNSIPVHHLAAGTYLLQIQQGGKVMRHKFIKR